MSNTIEVKVPVNDHIHRIVEKTAVQVLDETGVSATESAFIDAVTPGTAAANKAVVLGASKEVAALGKVTFGTATNALLHGAGASGANHALGATAGNGLEYYLNATHTSGDMRGQYIRVYFSGSGGSGEALRAFGTVNNVSVATGGTVNGAHVSLSATGASAAISGAGNALRATFGAGANTNVGGTCAVMQVDTDFDTAATIPPNFAFLRFTNSNTGVAANLMRIPNVSNGTIFAAHTTQVMTHSIKIVSEDGTPYYLMATDADTNRS